MQLAQYTVLRPLAQYTVLRPLGAGTFGKVFLASASNASGRVAVKVARHGVERTSMQAEYDCMRACAHPGVVSVIELLQGDGLQALPAPYRRSEAALVMEAATQDLAAFLELHGSCLDAELVREWSFNLASAVAHVHGNAFVHRDIKPANILLFLNGASTKAGGFVQSSIKLSDFGSARLLPQGPRQRIIHKSTVCKTGENDGQSLHREHAMTPLVCTAWYRAPELLPATVTAEALDMVAEPRGWEKYGAAVDVWSFGAVLCELLTGQPLARASSGAGLVRCLLQRLGPCPCDTDGCPRRLPAYLASEAWAALRTAASDRPMCREAWPWPADDARGVVLDACLQWRPSQRPSMSTLIRMPWFQPKTAAAEPPRPLLPCLDAGGSHQRGGSQSPHASTLGIPASRLAVDYSKRETEATGKPCECKGHCRVWKHRQRQCCDERRVVIGTPYCQTCLCKVYGCRAPKLKTEYCSMHQRVLDSAPLHVQLAILAADLAPLLLPCDVVDFLRIYPEIRSDLPICIICALIKEPTATAHILVEWRKLPRGYSAAQLGDALSRVARACVLTPGEDSPHVHELEQLTRQGVARFTGLAIVLKVFGVTRAAAESEAAAALTLGLTRQPHVLTGNTEVLAAFLSTVRTAEQSTPTPCLDAGDPSRFGAIVCYARKLHELTRTLSQDIQLFKTTGMGYTCDFVVRKLCMPLWPGIPWETIPGSELRIVSADQTEALAEFPADWTAAQISAFVCQRPDWPWLVSVYTCCWKEVADADPRNAKETLRRLCVGKPGASTPGELSATLCRFHERHGFPPPPTLLSS